VEESARRWRGFPIGGGVSSKVEGIPHRWRGFLIGGEKWQKEEARDGGGRCVSERGEAKPPSPPEAGTERAPPRRAGPRRRRRRLRRASAKNAKKEGLRACGILPGMEIPFH